jgi:hyperosmotically inducible protein
MRRSLFSILSTLVLVVGCSQSDSGITTSVKSKLIADDMVKARNLNVDTRDRVVTISGEVQSPMEEARAIDLARNTKGVADVVDKMAVVSSGEPGAAPTSGRSPESTTSAIGGAISDVAITSEVKSKLLADPGVSGLRIDVDTSDRVVTLSGTVQGAAEKMRAIELARSVSSVARVEDKLVVQPAR